MKELVVVLAGGPSAEREVSFWSAETIGVALKKLGKKFVVIDPAQKDWQVLLKDSKPTLVLIALHGPFGEDGQLQKILEKEGIPFSGSDSRVSALAINKEKAKKVVGGLGIATPKNYRVRSRLPYPVVVKPLTNGSSFGVTIVKDAAGLSPALEEAKKFDRPIIEQYIGGTELSCGVIDLRGSVEALPVIEIVSKNEFFDFSAKYDGRSCDEIVPARIPDTMTKKIQSYSEEIFRQFGCRHYARIDWVLRDEIPYFLEQNTLPGLTKNSLINKELLAAGISFEGFIDLLIKKALF